MVIISLIFATLKFDSGMMLKGKFDASHPTGFEELLVCGTCIPLKWYAFL